MVDPVSIGVITAGTMAATAAGGILGAFGSKAEGKAKANMYNYQASVAKINQDIAKKNAEYSVAIGERRAQDIGMKGRYEVGQAKAMQAGRGLDVNTGSAAAVRDSMEMMTAHKQNVERANALKTAYGYEVEGMSQGAQATMYGMSASDASRAGELGFYTSLLGTASSVSSKWMQASKAGMFT